MALCGCGLYRGSPPCLSHETHAQTGVGGTPFLQLSGLRLTPRRIQAGSRRIQPCRNGPLTTVVCYPGGRILVRDINKKMADYIIEYFDGPEMPERVGVGT